jgi:uncharacterized protein (DUF697 family)
MSNPPPQPDPLQDAIAFAQRLGNDVANLASQTEAEVSRATQEFLEEATHNIGQGVEPIANSRLLDLAARVPGFSWILAAVGRVDTNKIQAEVAKLRADHPDETVEQLCDRVISSAAIVAGGMGFVTNLIPPLALMLFAVDLVAVATLQAEMIYRVAALYGFNLTEPTRRGEVLSIFGLSLAAASALKAGLSAAELIPLVGTAIGVTSNAGLLYILGKGARQFYQQKAERG